MATDGDGPTDKAQEMRGGGSKELLSALKSKELLIPAALSAASALAAAKGPGLVRKLSGEGEGAASKLGERAAEGAKDALGASASLPGKALKKAVGKSEGEGKKTRRLPVERWTDVAVPVERAYAAWTDFEQFPSFMHRVLRVEQQGNDGVSWEEKIWFSTRKWEGRITERRENDRIAWTTTEGMSHRGVVSFHRLGDNLTRVMVTMEFVPQGVIEKMASGMRFVKRAVESDLARFKAFVEMEDARGLEYRPTETAGSDDGRRQSKDDESRDEDREERRSRREQRRETVVGR
jgi:uncharacterized membrane protein